MSSKVAFDLDSPTKLILKRGRIIVMELLRNKIVMTLLDLFRI